MTTDRNSSNMDSKVDTWLNSWNPEPAPVNLNSHLEPIRIEESLLRKKVMRWFFLCFGAFLIWAFYAPIDAGVTASGQVVVSGYRKAIQHPSGGVVAEILISEGDRVTKGQVVIKVNPLKERASLSAIESEFITVLTGEARLRAERINSAHITWPLQLAKLSNQAQVKESEITQTQLFNARRQELQETIAAKSEQQKSLLEEEAALAELAAEGYVPKATAAQAKRTRIEMVSTMNTFKSAFLKGLETEMSDLQKRHEALQSQLELAIEEEEHNEIRSPIDGTIVGLKVNTVGGVITSGQILAEVVPSETLLVVDVKLPVAAIDRVTVNQIVDVHFTQFNKDTTPVVPGMVKKVAADKVIPDKTKPGEPDFEYYPVQVETLPEGLVKLHAMNMNILPGMPVDVVIKTGERSFMSYIFKPLSDKLIWAFKS